MCNSVISQKLEQARLVERALSALPQCEDNRCDTFAEWHVNVGTGRSYCTTHAKLQADSLMVVFRHLLSGRDYYPAAFDPPYKFMRLLDEVSREWR